ncbi:unnamed protein product [Anisakis simplex]|uniref:Secreted protein n=1 Tax=Anisakis simplex TaxID=6269 RepID=A0A0M3J0N3_ANISI|nr:unnamed protein product [Anisakis simplex]
MQLSVILHLLETSCSSSALKQSTKNFFFNEYRQSRLLSTKHLSKIFLQRDVRTLMSDGDPDGHVTVCDDQQFECHTQSVGSPLAAGEFAEMKMFLSVHAEEIVRDVCLIVKFKAIFWSYHFMN